MCRQILNSNSSTILELSVKFVSQICYENINKPLDDTYLADFGMDIMSSGILEEETGVSPGWLRHGGLSITANEARLNEFK